MVPWSKYIDVCMCVPTSVSFVHLSIIGSLLSFRYRQKSCYFIRPWSPTTHRLSIRSWWLCMQRPFIVNTMAVVGIPEYPSDVSCNFDVAVGRRRPHRIWFNRPGALPPHHVLYILTFVVFGVSMVGCMVARDVHYVDGTLMHRLMGVNHDKLALSWILRRVSCSTPGWGYHSIRRKPGYRWYYRSRCGTVYWLIYGLPPTRVEAAAMVDVWNVICEMWRAWFFVPLIYLENVFHSVW